MKGFLSLNEFFRSKFGQRVQKIPLDAGLGCPNRVNGKGGCIYCNYKGSGTGASFKGIPIKQQIEHGIAWARRRYKANKFAAYFQAFTNTFGSLDELRAIYCQVSDFEDIVVVAIGTRPDCVDAKVLDLIHECFPDKMVWLEYGLQSSSDKTLKRINRGHSVQDFIDAVELTKRYPFYICAHIIFGLPGESKKDMLNSVTLLRDLDVDGVKFHELYVVKGTKLHELYQNELYTPITQQDYVELVAESITLLGPDTVIQRLTGDPAPGELIAPSWASDKQKTITLIKELLNRQ